MPSKDEEADFAKAYKDLVEAEKTAATLEAQLNSLEQKLDNFLAEHDKEEKEKEEVGWEEKRSEASPSSPSQEPASGEEGIGNTKSSQVLSK